MRLGPLFIGKTDWRGFRKGKTYLNNFRILLNLKAESVPGAFSLMFICLKFPLQHLCQVLLTFVCESFLNTVQLWGGWIVSFPYWLESSKLFSSGPEHPKEPRALILQTPLSTYSLSCLFVLTLVFHIFLLFLWRKVHKLFWKIFRPV
jgi:hypothetical protein